MLQFVKFGKKNFKPYKKSCLNFELFSLPNVENYDKKLFKFFTYLI